jgi:hypothetical protein
MAKGNNIAPPPEFSGEAQLILFTRYGDPRETGWDNKWLNNWHVKAMFEWFPVSDMLIHKHFRPLLEKAFRLLEMKDLHREIKTFDGCFGIRGMGNNETVLSVHSWGAAIDLNAMDNPIGSQGLWGNAFIDAMEQCDVFCGQNWTGRKDPKHFAMVNG